MPLSFGDKLGPYEILMPIGAGGMGQVYRAHDSRLNRDVAIKVSTAQFTERFEREAKAIAALNHSNICQVYDVGPNYLVMELIEGTPLKGPLTLDQALRYAAQICDALDAAHKKNIVHRDLKPANILVTASGVKLLDFGLAKTTVSSVPDGATETMALTEAGTVMGTPAYMSPEQAKGEEADTRSDIFSFGVVFYEMLSGRRTFARNSSAETMSAILRDEPAPLDAPSRVSEIVMRCLRKSSQDRFQTIGDVRRALDQASAEPVEQQPSIAVLPFTNLSADKDNEYFSDGLAEEILNALTQLPGLRVIARASAFAFRGRENAIAEIAVKLQVTSVLHGSVRRAGNRIRVTVQLINVADESQIWAERYDREMADVFDIQDEIAQAIVAQLKVKLGNKTGQPLVKRYTENLEAHSLYLRGNFHLYRYTAEDMRKGREYLEQAVVLDPGYAPAWVQLADYYIASAHLGASSPLDLWPKARSAAAKALEADSQFAEAHAALGMVKALSEFRWGEGLSGIDTALRLNPASARVHFWHARVLKALGRNEESFSAAFRAVELDPLSTLFHYYCAQFCLSIGQPERALEHAGHALEIDPNSAMSQLALGEAHSLLGRHEEGIAWIEKALSVVPGTFVAEGYLAWAYVRGGRRADAERFRADLDEKSRRQYMPPGTLALVAAGLGDVQSAFRLVEEGIRLRDPNINTLIRSPYFQQLQSDPRYPGLLRSMNLQP